MPPVGDSARPAGNEPDVSAQLYGATPPLACRLLTYAVPVMPSGSGSGVVMSRSDSMWTWNVFALLLIAIIPLALNAQIVVEVVGNGGKAR